MAAPKWLKNKLALAVMAIVLILVLGAAAGQLVTVQKAHSSFGNYYAFRGCEQLIKRAPDYGICKTASGKTIKMVEFRGKWYLDHDLPTCVRNFCF